MVVPSVGQLTPLCLLSLAQPTVRAMVQQPSTFLTSVACSLVVGMLRVGLLVTVTPVGHLVARKEEWLVLTTTTFVQTPLITRQISPLVGQCSVWLAAR
jgi:hypothetical protein